MSSQPPPAVLGFTWSDELLVGVPIIDAQHRRLVEMIGEFYSALAESVPPKEAFGELLRGLVQYTQYHFTTEERLMAECGFPQEHAHHRQHEAFVQKINDLTERFTQGQLVLSIEATIFLREWLTHHILVVDKELGRHLQARGVS